MAGTGRLLRAITRPSLVRHPDGRPAPQRGATEMPPPPRVSIQTFFYTLDMRLDFTEFREQWMTPDARLRPYAAYVPPPIADLALALPSDIAERERRATAACTAVGSGVLGVRTEAIARQLLRSEAVASSRIEGYQVSHRNLARAFVEPEAARDTAAFVVANVRAMEAAIELGAASGLSTAVITEIHRRLLEGTRDAPIAGRVRTEQNWIGGDGPHAAEFVPPPAGLVPGLLDDLGAFAARTDLPALSQAAIVHAQFETIHPFADGNGRVGRALIHAVLRRRGVTADAAIPISLALAASGDRYVEGLTAYRFDDIWAWVGYFAERVEAAAEGSLDLARRIEGLQRRWHEQAGSPRRHSASARMIPELVGLPVFRIGQMAERIGMSDEAVRVGVSRLVEADVLRPVTIGRRNRVFECVDLFRELDDFERGLAPVGRSPRPSRR